jgi:2-polyprenyl-6-methoxyphenol hydroxylase-like FAD-dependent oxidoreductase
VTEVIVCGGGICGLGTALLLAADGHQVTVLERDRSTLPDSAEQAWEAWERHGVAQFRQPHNFMPGLRQVVEAELPGVYEGLARAGAYKWDFLGLLLPLLPDQSPRPGDDRFSFWTSRRPAGEWVFGHAAQNHPGIEVRRGIQVTELVTGAPVRPGIPQVTGVRTAEGEEIRADVVIDAMGRRSKGPGWLAAVGARPPEEIAEDSGFTYYTRYFAGAVPEMIGPPLAPIGSISILRLPGDHDTWSVTIFSATGDQPLKRLRDAAAWTRVIQACPLHAPWLEGESITDVLPMSGVMDRYRSFVVDGRPVATGFFAVADAWACTNPSAGRGLTVGFKHAVQLRDVLRADTSDPYAQAEEFHRRTQSDVAPWFWSQISADRARLAEIEALCEGRDPRPPSDPVASLIGDLNRFVAADPDIGRAFLSYVGTLTPIQQTADRPEILERLATLKEAAKDQPPLTIPGPDRENLLALVS